MKEYRFVRVGGHAIESVIAVNVTDGFEVLTETWIFEQGDFSCLMVREKDDKASQAGPNPRSNEIHSARTALIEAGLMHMPTATAVLVVDALEKDGFLK